MAEVCRIGDAHVEEGGKEGWKESGLKAMRLASSLFPSFLTCLLAFCLYLYNRSPFCVRLLASSFFFCQYTFKHTTFTSCPLHVCALAYGLSALCRTTLNAPIPLFDLIEAGTRLAMCVCRCSYFQIFLHSHETYACIMLACIN